VSINASLQKFISQQSSYIFDPVKWAYEVLHFDADNWQKEALRDLVEKRFCAWSTGTGVGKSTCLAIAGLWFLSTRPFPKIPCTAPSQHQLYDVLWAEYAKWMRQSELLTKMFKWTQTRIGLRGHEEEWYAVARTSRPKPGEAHAEGLQGFHSGHILFEVDEGSAVADSVYSAMDGAFTSPESYGIIASNPTRRSGYFFKQIVDPEKSTYAVKFVSAYDAKMVTRASIDLAIKKYGEDSDYVRVKVKGLPPLVDFAALFSDEDTIAMHEREYIPTDSDYSVVSCDPARFGNDESVVYARKGSSVNDRLALKGMDTMQVAKIVLDVIYRHNAQICLIDVIGIGSGVADRVREELRKAKHSCIVIDVNVAEGAVDDVQYANKRAEMYWHLRERIPTISLPFETTLLDEELVAIRYSAEKKILIEKKEELKREIGRSPNDADALGLLFYNEILRNDICVSPTCFRMGAKSDIEMVKTANALEIEQFAASNPGLMGRSRVVGVKRYAPLFAGSSFAGRGDSRFRFH
jgi:phage terminase large subunit